MKAIIDDRLQVTDSLFEALVLFAQNAQHAPGFGRRHPVTIGAFGRRV